eukprot:4824497-Amphidinium_carterae.1
MGYECTSDHDSTWPNPRLRLHQALAWEHSPVQTILRNHWVHDRPLAKSSAGARILDGLKCLAKHASHSMFKVFQSMKADMASK